MIEIRLVEDHDKIQLKFILEKIKRVAPRELTYGVEAGMDTVDVNIEDAKTSATHRRYERYSEAFPNDLWVVIYEVGYKGYWQGERYGGESLELSRVHKTLVVEVLEYTHKHYFNNNVLSFEDYIKILANGKL